MWASRPMCLFSFVYSMTGLTSPFCFPTKKPGAHQGVCPISLIIILSSIISAMQFFAFFSYRSGIQSDVTTLYGVAPAFTFTCIFPPDIGCGNVSTSTFGNFCMSISLMSLNISAFSLGSAVAENIETLAISWAVLKCQFFLKGMQHFEVCTDHRPLLGTFWKPLSRIDNPRIVRLREKVLDYNFSITWVAGKDNIIADALSRSVPKPQSAPHRLFAIRPASTATVSMATIIEHANSCPTYFKIKNALSNDKHPASLPPTIRHDV